MGSPETAVLSLPALQTCYEKVSCKWESELCSEANKESLEDWGVVFTSAFVANNSSLSKLQLLKADAAESERVAGRRFCLLITCLVSSRSFGIALADEIQLLPYSPLEAPEEGVRLISLHNSTAVWAVPWWTSKLTFFFSFAYRHKDFDLSHFLLNVPVDWRSHYPQRVSCELHRVCSCNVILN